MLKELRSRLTISETKSAYYDSKQAEFDNQVNLQKVFKADVARYQVLATTWKDRVEAILLEFSEFKKSHLDCVSSKKHSISLQKIQKISKDYDQITITKNKLEDRIKVLQDCLLKLVESTVSRVKPDFNVKTRSEEIARTFLGVGLDEAVGINPQSIMSSLKEILASDIIMLPQFTRELIQ